MTTVRLEGFKGLEKELENLEKLSTRKAVARRAAKKAMQPMADLARSLAPDDPTTPPVDLKTSIVVSSQVRVGRSFRKLREGPTNIEIYMGPTSEGYPQAITQEFGTVHHAPQPYMRPAWEQDQKAMLDRLGEIMWIEVKKSVARANKKAARG